MKTKSADLDEGAIAFDRFKAAMKKIVAAPKAAIDRKEKSKKTRPRRHKAALSHG